MTQKVLWSWQNHLPHTIGKRILGNGHNFKMYDSLLSSYQVPIFETISFSSDPLPAPSFLDVLNYWMQGCHLPGLHLHSTQGPHQDVKMNSSVIGLMTRGRHGAKGQMMVQKHQRGRTSIKDTASSNKTERCLQCCGTQASIHQVLYH